MPDTVKIDVTRAARSAAKIEAAKAGVPMSQWVSDAILLAAAQAETRRKEDKAQEASDGDN